MSRARSIATRATTAVHGGRFAGLASAVLVAAALWPTPAVAQDSIAAEAATHGMWSLAPAVVAIGLAIVTRRVIVSLLIGVLVGALLTSHGLPHVAVHAALTEHIWGALADEDHLHVFTFTLFMGAMVGVVNYCGGMHGLVEKITRVAYNRRRGQMTTWVLGMVVFFDDYANTLLLGTTLRPLTDRLRISREKLAYLVDSTAAPVAGVALISSWVAVEMGYIADGLATITPIDGPADPFVMFVATIPYRFYVMYALWFVLLIAASGRDFGPMLAAERRAAAGHLRPGGGLTAEESMLAPPEGIRHRWGNAVVPIVVTVLVVLILMAVTGADAIRAEATRPDTAVGQETLRSVFSHASLSSIFSQGNAYVSLMYGALAGWCAAMLLVAAQRLLNWGQLSHASAAGARLMVPGLAILTLAWALQSVNDALDTAEYLGDMIQQAVSPQLMPTLVFLLAAAVSFATGSSWGTMAILMPLAIPTTFHLIVAQAPGAMAFHPLLVASIGSVLAGAIFGDHCSPISDTTVLSSRASGCDHMAHVWTQLPYALSVAAISVLCGTLPVGFGAPVWITLPLGGVALVAICWCFGQPVVTKESDRV